MERQWDGRDAVQRLYRVVQQIRRCPANRDAMELSIGENGLLCCLSKHADGVTASELKRMTGIGASGVTNLMNALERKGLIRREMNPSDRRSVLVTISDAGRALVETRQRRLADFTQELLCRMGQTDADELVRLLEKMNRISDELYAQKADERK